MRLATTTGAASIAIPYTTQRNAAPAWILLSVSGRRKKYYDSDAYNDELPYWIDVGKTPHLVVPYSLGPNDVKFGRGTLGTAEDYFTYVRDGFDVLYREGRRHPKMMSLGLHLRLIGHPSRAAGLERVLDYITRHAGVWICRRIDIARHWIAAHPPTSRGSRVGA